MRIHLEAGPAAGTLAAPPSKSLAHRAVICAALARGVSHISNLEYSRDITATIGAMRQLCARIYEQDGRLRVEGIGGFATITRPVDCGESGSTLRFLWPLFSLTDQKVTFTGQGRLMQRPLSVYEEIAQRQGLRTEKGENTVSVFGRVHPGEYRVPGDVSSQFISGLLLALPLLEKDSVIRITPPFESRSYVQLTLAAMAAFGVAARWQDPFTLLVPGGQRYAPADYTVEGDYSQAAFFAVLGAACGGITITGLPERSLQGDAAILPIVQRCGAAFTRSGGTVRFEKPAAPLRGTHIDLADCPDLGPILMVLGALCEGETVITNAGRLRIKESDRIAAMEAELRRFGVQIASTEDTVTVQGTGAAGLHAPAGPLDGHNDHRVVMSLTVLALAGGFAADIDGAEAVEKSWLAFFEQVQQLGAKAVRCDG